MAKSQKADTQMVMVPLVYVGLCWLIHVYSPNHMVISWLTLDPSSCFKVVVWPKKPVLFWGKNSCGDPPRRCLRCFQLYGFDTISKIWCMCLSNLIINYHNPKPFPNHEKKIAGIPAKESCSNSEKLCIFCALPTLKPYSIAQGKKTRKILTHICIYIYIFRDITYLLSGILHQVGLSPSQPFHLHFGMLLWVWKLLEPFRKTGGEEAVGVHRAVTGLVVLSNWT